ncbi:MAG TPA: hypothetical protein VIY69_16715 [Candidatus Acidoferrales bacterium]
MDEQTECNEALAEPATLSLVPVKQAPHEDEADPAIERHSRKCQICHHPDREAIEKEYVGWGQPPVIAQHYGVPVRALYRHYDAVGLGSNRRANLRQVLERILERGAEVPITGNTVIHAVKAYCSLTDDNKWIEPAKSVTFTVQNEPKMRQADGIDQFERATANPHSLIADRGLLIDTEPIRK